MNPTDTETFTAYADILNEVLEMFDALDQYRKLHREKKHEQAQKNLFKSHSHEAKARKMINRELSKQNSNHLKSKAA